MEVDLFEKSEAYSVELFGNIVGLVFPFITSLSLMLRAEAPIKVFLNGTALVMDASGAERRSYPCTFRAIGEALMAEVDWDGSAGRLL